MSNSNWWNIRGSVRKPSNPNVWMPREISALVNLEKYWWFHATLVTEPDTIVAWNSEGKKPYAAIGKDQKIKNEVRLTLSEDARFHQRRAVDVTLIKLSEGALVFKFPKKYFELKPGRSVNRNAMAIPRHVYDLLKACPEVPPEQGAMEPVLDTEIGKKYGSLSPVDLAAMLCQHKLVPLDKLSTCIKMLETVLP